MSLDTVGKSFIRVSTLEVAVDPTSALEVATKQYVDSNAGTLPFVTVGVSGADYTSIGAAISANNYNMYVISGIAESADVSIGANGDYHIWFAPNTSDNFGSFKINILNGTTANIKIFNGTILFSYAVATDWITYTGSGTGDQTFEGVKWINTSSTGACRINAVPTASGPKQRFIGCTVNLPNQADCGMQVAEGQIERLVLLSGGSSCEGALLATRAIVNGVQFQGAAWSANTVATFFAGASVSNIFVSSAVGTPLVRVVINDDVILSGVMAEDTSGFRIVMLGDSVLSNFALGDAGSFFLGGGSGSCTITNGKTPQGSITTSSVQAKISNVRFYSGDCTIEADGALISNCDFDASCVIDGNNIKINNINCGASGGVTNTVALVIGAQNCRITNANVEIAIVDGSGNATNSYNYDLWI